MLPENDQSHLDERFPNHAVSADGGMIAVLLPCFPLPVSLLRAREVIKFAA